MTWKQFPQINRKLTATALMIFFAIFTILNLAQNEFFKADGEKKLRFLLMQNPKDSNSHEKLGQYYLQKDEETAKREYLLAQEYYLPGKQTTEATVLGIQSNPWQTWQNFVAKKNNLDNEILYWQEVSEIYPLYHYAYLKLAQFNFEKGNTEKAKDYLETILRQDPTNQEAKRLLEIIK